MTILTKFSLIYVLSTLISSFSQMILKKSSQKKYSSKIREYLNPLVISAYGIFFLCTFVTMYALKVVPLSMSPMLESTGYIFVAILSRVFFKEIPDKRQIIGLLLILAGIFIYSL